VSSSKDVPSGGFDDDPQFKGVQTPKNPKRGRGLNWQNHKITSTAKIGWTPNFDRVIKLHG